MLKVGPVLHALTPNFVGNLVAEVGTQAFAMVKGSPSLHILPLNLEDNDGGALGAQGVAELKETPLHCIYLHILTLNLDMEDCGTQALAALQSPHTAYTNGSWV